MNPNQWLRKHTYVRTYFPQYDDLSHGCNLCYLRMPLHRTWRAMSELPSREIPAAGQTAAKYTCPHEIAVYLTLPPRWRCRVFAFTLYPRPYPYTPYYPRYV